MRIHWGLAIALGATFAWVNLAQAAGPKIESVRIDGARDEARVSIDGAFDNPKYAVRTREDGRLIIIDIEDAALPPDGRIDRLDRCDDPIRPIAAHQLHGRFGYAPVVQSVQQLHAARFVLALGNLEIQNLLPTRLRP